MSGLSVGFETAKKRSNRLCSVEKSNVLEVSQLWKEVVTRVHEEEYPDVELTHMYVDNAAMQIIRAPTQFDTIVTGNIFGDILSDAASCSPGASACSPPPPSGPTGRACTSPCTVPRRTSRARQANPLAQVLSAAMMLRYQFTEEDASANAEAVSDCLDDIQNRRHHVRRVQKVGCVLGLSSWPSSRPEAGGWIRPKYRKKGVPISESRGRDARARVPVSVYFISPDRMDAEK